MVMAAALCAALASGCGSFKRVSHENDRLRALVMDLQQENEDLTNLTAELEARLLRAGNDSGVAPDVRDATPHVATISIDAISHVLDDDGDGRPDTLVLYVTPSDGLGRFVQMVGDLSVHMAMLPTDSDAVSIGRIRLGPRELRAAYRSTFLGTHYTITMPISIPGELHATGCTVRAEFLDGYDGRRVTDQRELSLVLDP